MPVAALVSGRRPLAGVSDGRWTPPLNRLAVLLAGLGPGVIHLTHFSDGMDPLSTALLGCGIGLVLATGLVGAAGWAQYDPTVPVPAAWTLAGLGIGAGAAVLTIVQQTMIGGVFVTPGYYAAAMASCGAAGGYATGFYRIRARRRAAVADRERDRFEDLFGNLPNPAVDFVYRDGAPHVRRANDAFLDTFGFDAAAVQGRPIDALLSGIEPPADAAEAAARLAADGPVATAIRQRAAGEVRYFDLYAFPTPTAVDRDGIAADRAPAAHPTGVAIAIDVTDRRRRERRVTVLNRVLRHDLRNRTNVIAGHAELLAAGEVAPEAATDDIKTAATGLMAIADRSREIERLVREREVDPTPTDVAALAARVVDDRAAAHPEATISLDIPERAPALATDLLEVALTELVDNAIEHHDDATPTVTVSVRVDDDRLIVRVADDGPGIPAHERRIHRRGTETDLDHSHGLGLWLVDWIVEDLGGEVAYHDNESRGSVVILRLPQSRSGSTVSA